MSWPSTELVKPLCQLLGQDAQLWMLATGECVCEVVQCIVTALCWLNADLLAKLSYGNHSIQLWHSHPTLTATPRQPENLDACGKLRPLPRATGEDGEPHLAGAEGTV